MALFIREAHNMRITDEGAYLEDIHVLKQRQVSGAHNLGDNGQARFPAGSAQKRQPLFPQAGEAVGGGTGLIGTAPEELRPGSLDAAGDGKKLLL